MSVSFRADDGKITGMHPSRIINRVASIFGFLPISFHHRITAVLQFALHAARYTALMRIDDLDLHMRMHPSDSTDAPLEALISRSLKLTELVSGMP